MAIKSSEEDRKPLAWKHRWLHDYDSKRKTRICRKKKVICLIRAVSLTQNSSKNVEVPVLTAFVTVTGLQGPQNWCDSYVRAFLFLDPPSLRVFEWTEAHWWATGKSTIHIYQRSTEALFRISFPLSVPQFFSITGHDPEVRRTLLVLVDRKG